MFARQPVAALPSLQINFPTDWLASLTDLLKILKTPFERVDALLVAMADDFAGGVMLRWLLYLFPKSRREDGAVYKSAVEWQAQVGLSKHQVERLKKQVLPGCGIDVTIKKANGAPTCHYYLDGWRFLRRLGAVLSLPIPYLLIKLQQSGNPFTGKRTMDLLESGKSLTDDSTNESNKQVVNDSSVDSKIVDFKNSSVPDLLQKNGLSQSQAAAYAGLPEAVVQACIQSATEAQPRKFVPYLIGALKNQLQAHFGNRSTAAPPPNPLPVAAVETANVEETGRIMLSSEAAQAARDKWADVLARLHAGTNTEPAPEAVNERLAVIIGSSNYWTVQRVWDAAYQQLELQLDRPSFDTYLRSAKLVDYESGDDSESACLVVRVHNSYARDMLQHRLYRNVARILRGVIGHEVTVRFEADETNAAAGQGLKRFLPMNSEK